MPDVTAAKLPEALLPNSPQGHPLRPGSPTHRFKKHQVSPPCSSSINVQPPFVLAGMITAANIRPHAKVLEAESSSSPLPTWQPQPSFMGGIVWMVSQGVKKRARMLWKLALV